MTDRSDTAKFGPALIGAAADPITKRLAFRLTNPNETWPLVVLEKNWLAGVGLLFREVHERARSRRSKRGPRSEFSDDELREWIAQTRRLIDSFDIPGEFPNTRASLQRIVDGIDHALKHEPTILRRTRYTGSVFERRLNLYLWGWDQMRELFNSLTPALLGDGAPKLLPGQETFWTTQMGLIAEHLDHLPDTAAILKRIQRIHGQMSQHERSQAFAWFLQSLRRGPVRIDGSLQVE